MKIIIQRGEDETTIDPGVGQVELQEVFNGIGMPTDQGYFGIAMRDDGIEVLLDGKLVWSSTTELGNAKPCPHPSDKVRRRQVGRRVFNWCGRCGAKW